MFFFSILTAALETNKLLINRRTITVRINSTSFRDIYIIFCDSDLLNSAIKY